MLWKRKVVETGMVAIHVLVGKGIDSKLNIVDDLFMDDSSHIIDRETNDVQGWVVIHDLVVGADH